MNKSLIIAKVVIKFSHGRHFRYYRAFPLTPFSVEKSLLWSVGLWFHLILNSFCSLDNYWSIDRFFLLVKILASGEAFVSFSDSRKLSSILVYIFRVVHFLLFRDKLLTDCNKICVKVQLCWSINLLIKKKSLFGFAKTELYSASIIFL